MTTIEVSMKMNIGDDYVDYAKTWTHHIERIIDVDNHPEIYTIYDVKVTKK